MRQNNEEKKPFMPRGNIRASVAPSQDSHVVKSDTKYAVHIKFPPVLEYFITVPISRMLDLPTLSDTSSGTDTVSK